MVHVEQLRASRGPILKATCELHKIGICGCEKYVIQIKNHVIYGNGDSNKISHRGRIASDRDRTKCKGIVYFCRKFLQTP
jgi:hypothetical protein